MASPLIALLRRRVAIKLTLTLLAFVAVSSLVAGLYLNRALEAFATDSLQARLEMAGRLLHDDARRLIVRRASPAELAAFAVAAKRTTSTRITIVAVDGRVIADSDVPVDRLSLVENHAERPEVKAALAGGVGSAVRTSDTIHEALFYVGRPITDDGRVVGVLRLALPLSVVTSSYATVHRDIWLGGLVALAVALAIGLVVSRRITRPVVEMQAVARRMTEGDFTVRPAVDSTDEIGDLGVALGTMATRLRDQIHDLEREQAKVTAILDGMVEGVLAVDAHERILWMNERARTMFRLDAARGHGRPLLEVVRNAELHGALRASRTLDERGSLRREIRLVNHGELIVEVNAVPLPLETGGTGVLMVLHDITALRRLEQMRTEFIANVSHELRTPLTAIQGYVETLLGGALAEPEHAERFLEIVLRHTERLGRLLNDLTDLSNIELGKISLQLVATAVPPVVDSVLTIIRPRAESNRIALHVDLPDALPRVYADHDRLAQILINLVDNAVKYTAPGGHVTVAAALVGPATVEISVLDSGIGIPAADLPRITERFYRVDKARSRALGGTGLGLAIVKHLVLAHGGELRIESEPGRGTLVRVTLAAVTEGG